MADASGMPIWYELMTTDVDGARRFYGDIVGWTTDEMSTAPGMPPYTIWHAGDGEGVGAVIPLPDGAPTKQLWVAYFHVADVDAKIAENEAAGGRTFMPGYDIPHVGRIAYLADPQGIPFYLMTPTPPPDRADAQSTAFSETLRQRCSWNELVTGDHKAALAHYQKLFGWTSPEVMPMGAMGDYSFVNAGDMRIGAAMDASAPQQPRAWTFYFRIPDVDAAVEQVKAGGGQVMMGPMDVPGGQRVIICTDPQGAQVGFVSGEHS